MSTEFIIANPSDTLGLKDRERLSELTRGTTEEDIVQYVRREYLKNDKLPIHLQKEVTWNSLATEVWWGWPPVLKRGAELAVYKTNYKTALFFLRAAANLCPGWPATIAYLLIAACCKELGDAQGMADAIDAFEHSRCSLVPIDLRGMAWEIPGFDRNGYRPGRGPDWFPDREAAIRYVESVKKRTIS